MAKKRTVKRARKSARGTTPPRRAPQDLHVHPSTVVPTGPAPKLSRGDRVRATDKAPANFAGRVGVVRDLGPGKQEYRVRFGKDKTDVGLLYGQWLRKVGG